MADTQVPVEVEGTTPETEATETQGTGEPAELGEAGKKALKAERDRAAQAEKEAKDLKARLDELERAQMSEQERAVAEAREEARKETRAEFGSQLVAAEVKVAATGLLAAEQIDTLIEDLNLAKFLSQDGQVDVERVKAFVEGIAPKATDGTQRVPDLGQGARNSSAALGSDPLLQALKNTVGAR
jgi:hypothetical protein